MSGETSTAPGVLRGVCLERLPLRLGRAKAIVAPARAAGALVEEPAEDLALQQAHALAEKEGRDEGLRCGREQGLREGRAQAAEEIRQAVQRGVAQAELACKAEHERLQRIARHARCALADLLWSAQDEMAALCYETLCRMLGASAVQPEFLRAQLSHLLEQHGAPDVVLHLHPQDAALLQWAPDETPAARVIPDAGVAPGACILKSASGALEARLEAMLEACKAALLEARAGALRQRGPEEDA